MPTDQIPVEDLRQRLNTFISDKNCCSETAPKVAEELKKCANDFRIDPPSIQLIFATIPFLANPDPGKIPRPGYNNSTDAGVHTAVAARFNKSPLFHVIDTTIGQFKRGMTGAIQTGSHYYRADFVVVTVVEWQYILKFRAQWSRLPNISYQQDSEYKTAGGISDFFRTVPTQSKK